MKMNDDVVKFIKACEQPINDESAKLYRKLITEEYNEFIDAIVDDDEIEKLDACMDLIWVILGYCYTKGYNTEAAWSEVARSNLAKIDPVTGRVLKRADGKVLKPESWTPPNLTDYLKG